jgi:hypothetical protein
MTFFAENSSFSLGIIFAIIFSAMMLTVFRLIMNLKIEKSGHNHDVNIMKNERGSSFKKTFSIISEALLLKPHSSSCSKTLMPHENVFSIFLRAFGMILLIIYSTFILSSLIKVDDSIETIEELRSAVNEGRVRVWYPNVGTAVDSLLKVKVLIPNLLL